MMSLLMAALTGILIGLGVSLGMRYFGKGRAA